MTSTKKLLEARKPCFWCGAPVHIERELFSFVMVCEGCGEISDFDEGPMLDAQHTLEIFLDPVPAKVRKRLDRERMAAAKANT